MKSKAGFYEVMVYIAYGYFILLGLAWFVASMSGGINYTALGIVAIFGIQAYFKHRLTNLLLGIVTFALSIFMLLQSISMGGKGGFDAFVNVLIAMSAVSVVLSLILMFSFMKLAFKDA